MTDGDPYRTPATPEPGPAWTIGPEHLELARRTVRAHALLTPVVPAPALGTRVFLKLETRQLTGAFKVRGALTKLASLTKEERAKGVVTASAGNHGLGLAHAGRAFGVRTTVLVPKMTPFMKKSGMAALGADVIEADVPGYDATERAARERATSSGAMFVSPFDDPWVAAGNGGTIGFELYEGLPSLKAIVAPVGGGGLVVGLAAARAASKRLVSIIGVQSAACPAMARSLAEKRAITELAADGDTLAEGLQGGVSPTTFHHVREAIEKVDTVTEAEIRDAIRFAYRTLGITVEGSAAVVIAWAREHADEVPGEGAIVLVVTGENIDSSRLREIVE